MDYVTILGSCSQQSIAKYTNVTSIHEKFNYPHCTKEILQQIRYLKYKNISNENTKLLNKFQTEFSDNFYNILKTEFDTSSIFLVAISGRITYRWNNLYLHNIVEKTNLIMDLTDEEIEDDILNIRSELHPKPFIIINNYDTYDCGKKYELVKLLENICNKLNIPFLNLSNIVNSYDKNTYVKERILFNYTNNGLDYGKILFDKINEVKYL
jgi:hypothetical protein